MNKSEYLSVTQFAELLSISRTAVHKKIKKGQIKAIRFGKFFAIPKEEIDKILGRIKGKALKEGKKREIEKVVKKTVKEYGKALKELGKE